MSLKWSDTSSYRIGERGVTEPRSWTISSGPVSITVHRCHGCGEAWFVSCRQANIDTEDLEGPTLDEAKGQAIDRVRDKFNSLACHADSLASQHLPS